MAEERKPPLVPPGQRPQLPDIAFFPHPEHPIAIQPPPNPPTLPEGAKLILVWDGHKWDWSIVVT